MSVKEDVKQAVSQRKFALRTCLFGLLFHKNTLFLPRTRPLSLSLSLSFFRVRSILTCIQQDHDPVLDPMPSNVHSAEEMRRDSLAISTSVPRGSCDTARASRYHNPPPSKGSCGSLKGRWRDGGTDHVIQAARHGR